MDKEQQKKLLIELIDLDEKDGLYDQVPDIRKEVSAVSWLILPLVAYTKNVDGSKELSIGWLTKIYWLKW